MKILTIICVALFLIPMTSSTQYCSQYPLDPEACISKTIDIKCQFNQFQNSCIEAVTTNLGCSKSLNKAACLNQLSYPNESEAKCLFGTRCIDANTSSLKNLGCSDKFSKYACTNVSNTLCYWNDEKCSKYDQQIPSANSCEQVFNTSVNAQLCSVIQNLKCMNSGFLGDYKCITVQDNMLSQLKCTDLGLNESTCKSIITNNQICVFQNNNCQSIQVTSILSCTNLTLNRLACLSILNPKLLCTWSKGQCLNYTLNNNNQDCSSIQEVNPSVCALAKGLCSFDSINKKCQTITSLSKINCASQGISENACLAITGYNCSYYNGQCMELSNDDLSTYQCSMKLNQDSCVNLKTQFQYCIWNNSKCSRTFINQDTSCPYDETSLMNGNLCQAISSSKCKYNKSKFKCISSTNNDSCGDAYLNFYGCISITKSGMACQWTNENGCSPITVIYLQTTCDSIGYANPITCSQVFEGNSKGCYYNSDTQQCTTVVFGSQESTIIQSLFQCNDAVHGINKTLCASLTNGQGCRWYQNECTLVKNKQSVGSIPCLKLQYVSKTVCSMVTYNKQSCRYLSSDMSCTTSQSSNLKCSSEGLNSYACALISKENCYFDSTSNQCSLIDVSSDQSSNATTQELLQTMECVQSSPTKSVCKLIITEGQLCTWSQRSNVCTNQFVYFNEMCSTYGNKIVNANVCASIEMNFPDYNILQGSDVDENRGYCKFDNVNGNCVMNTNICTTTCCTDLIGINSHSCSRFSSQAPNVYCYFGNNLRCTQLTLADTNIYDSDSVKNYYNSKQYKCSQMNKNSCYMIEWSKKQYCYHNGNSCMNVNLSQFQNFDIFLQDPSITNKYLCFSIDATITSKNKNKYFSYDNSNHRCQINTYDQYTSCSEVNGNRNICLGKTPQLYCKWDSDNLQCLTITTDELSLITTCNYNQNQNACLNNTYTACQFLFSSDRCVNAPTNVSCDYFNLNGPVSPLTCKRIIKDGEMCEYNTSTKLCVNSQQQSQECDVSGANSITCYNNTSGQCRWNINTYECYNNHDDISTLGCLDQVNKILCTLITKEACVWDNAKKQCLQFINTTESNYLSENLYNKYSCLSISNAPYYYDDTNQLCVKLSSSQNDCTSLQLNQYACLINTRGYQCYYDTSYNIGQRCRSYTNNIQRSCQSSVQINIEICMQIPATCYFDLNTGKCLSVSISSTQLCSGLAQSSNYYNKLSCSSISETLSQYDQTDVKCTTNPDVEQSIYCKFEKYCKWDNTTYNCAVVNPASEFTWTTHVTTTIIQVPVTTDNSGSGDSGTGTSTGTSDSGTGDSGSDSGTGDSGSGSGTGSGEDIQYKDETVTTTTYSCDNTDTILQILCQNIYSRALCLYLNLIDNQCYFDLKQGGCNQLQGNEEKLTDCNSIVQNCEVSSTPGVICVQSNSVTFQQSGGTCSALQNTIYKCVSASASASYKCNTYSSSLSALKSPIICAGASDSCRYDSTNKYCTSQTANTCDKSMSKSMCETNQCDYSTLGYCQSKPITYPGGMYGCYLVNLLTISTKSQICGQVQDFPCYFSTTCQDATNFSCAKLIGYIVNLIACQTCIGQSMIYNQQTNLCTSLTTQVNSCDNLNKQSCLLQTQNVYCKWNINKCVTVTVDLIQNDIDCSIYNQYACYQVNNNCWIDSETGYCSILSASSAKCSDLNQAKQSTCILSNKEACVWNNGCVQAPTSQYTCEMANKYGCLNMSDQQCGWSEINMQCYTVIYKDKNISCSDFVDKTQQDYSLIYFNALTCSLLITDDKTSCFRDSYYKCRQPDSSDILTCNTPGINQQACISSTQGSCIYIPGDQTNISGTCNSTTNTTYECSTLLNINACIMQNNICTFDKVCKSYNVSKSQDIIVNDSNGYSISVCTALDADNTFTESIIYNQLNYQCFSISARQPFLDDCNFIGINKNACLQKTSVYCRYFNNQCQTITKVDFQKIQNCESNLNWYACTQITYKNCKFLNNQCSELDESDNCASLISTQALVSANSCAATLDQACYLNIQTNQCVKLTSAINVTCTQSGLNKQGCIFFTSGSQCKFSNQSCSISQMSEKLNCTDFVNQDKCLSINTLGQYCQFTTENGCQQITDNLDTCVTNIQSNPIRCSISTDQACVYDIKTHNCIVSPTESDDNTYLFDWDQNSLSFNSLSCINYSYGSTLAQWKDNQCQKILDVELYYLTCTDQVNSYGCLGITNPTQSCIFNNKCQDANLSDYVNIPCANITNISSSQFCEQAIDKPCGYDASTSSCKIISQIQQCQGKGYNQSACQLLSSCKFNDHCYQVAQNQYLTCSEALSEGISNCINVVGEGCDINCLKIAANYSQLKCSDVLNSFACSLITKQDQFCEFDNDLKLCVSVIPKSQSVKQCANIVNINNSIFCEQPTDVACNYSIDSKSCFQVTTTSKYTCIRGLNQIACLNNTITSLQCQFFEYCYGPNYDFLQCNPKLYDCCSFAYNLESCLFQNTYSCQWNNEKCELYLLDQNLSCIDIKYKSRQNCIQASTQNNICIFSSSTFSCINIIPTNCDQVQSSDQCSLLTNMPCYWDSTSLKCSYKKQQNTDQCSTIYNSHGNELACRSIEREGQLCIFNNYQCVPFTQITTSSNCLSNINKIACIVQTIDDCYWKTSDLEIKITTWSNSQTISIGECVAFNNYSTAQCSDQLSYTSCLKITTINSYCIWKQQKCQQLIQQTYSTLVLVNSNSCGLMNSTQNMYYYDENIGTCIILDKIDGITCDPFTRGLNKKACTSIKSQKCKWDQLNNQCIINTSTNNRLLLSTMDNRILSIDSCKIENVGPQICAEISLNQSCGFVEDGCDEIDINQATCSDSGLNEYACLHIITEPCIWISSQCQQYEPFTSCSQIIYKSNSLVCSLVEEDMCVYDQDLSMCITPTQVYDNCNIEGINSKACVQIDGCIFKNNKCTIYDQNTNYICSELDTANYYVCQSAIDRCKYSLVTNGCVSSTSLDSCYDLGLSYLGCSVLDQCKWDESSNSCGCLEYLTQFPKCNTITEYTDCVNKDYCFFELSASNSSKDLTQYLKNTNYGTCRDKTCNDLTVNKCDGYIINNIVCYLNKNNICQQASICEDIISPKSNCTIYKFNNQSCRQHVTNNNNCQTLICSQIIEQSKCLEFSSYCIYLNYCKTKTCEYMGEQQCQENLCDWNYNTEKCTVQQNCEINQNSDDCIMKKYNDNQCAWLITTGQNEVCSSNGCRYLGKSQGECMGTHIGTNVCVELQDFSCVSCEEINDTCVCLNNSQYCSYDKLNRKCISNSCQNHNKMNCPTSHCVFNQNNEICIPMCLYNYNSIQCNQRDDCTWNKVYNVCETYIAPIIVEPIILPSPNLAFLLTLTLTYIILF